MFFVTSTLGGTFDFISFGELFFLFFFLQAFSVLEKHVVNLQCSLNSPLLVYWSGSFLYCDIGSIQSSRQLHGNGIERQEVWIYASSVRDGNSMNIHT